MAHAIVPPYLLARIAAVQEPAWARAAEAARSTLAAPRDYRPVRSRLRLTIEGGDTLVAETTPAPDREISDAHGATPLNEGFRDQVLGHPLEDATGAVPERALEREQNLFRLVERQVEGAEHGGDVLVAALADLVDGELVGLNRIGNEYALDEFARPAILPAIGDEEVLEPQHARAFGRAQLDRRAQRDQRRRRVADR